MKPVTCTEQVLWYKFSLHEDAPQDFGSEIARTRALLQTSVPWNTGEERSTRDKSSVLLAVSDHLQLPWEQDRKIAQLSNLSLLPLETSLIRQTSMK